MRTMAIAAMLSALAVGARAQTPPRPPVEPAVVIAHGEASLKRAPDQAWVQIGVEARAATPAPAQKTAADAMIAVRASLKSLGVADEAVRTLAYTLQPETEYVNGASRFKGYLVRNQIEVRVDDLSRLPQVIDAAGSSGAAAVSGLRFDVKNRQALERQALREAVRDALARAEAMAAGAGRTLGDIVRLEEQGMPQPTPMISYAAPRMAQMESSTPVAPGEIEIRSQVMLTIGVR
jgi:uncharacterized protein